MRQLLLVLMGCLFFCTVPVAAMEPLPPQRLAHFDTMPKPALLPDGTLAAYFIEQRGPGLAQTPEQQTLTARYSKDDGHTWSDMENLFDLPPEEGGFGYFVVLVDHDGEVHFFFLCDANTGILRAREPAEGRPAVEPITRQSLDFWHVRSFDGRTRWSEPRQIWEGRAGDPQSVIQLKSGRILLPISFFVNRTWRDRGEGFDNFTFLGTFDTSALYSDDGGETWHQSESVLRVPTPHIGTYGAVEPVVVQLNDGRVWMLLRNQFGRFYESFSDDGSIWSPARPTEILSSDSPAGLVRLKDQRLLLFWNNCQRYPYAQGARHVLHAALSDDDGKTWRGHREVIRDAHRDEPPPPGGDWGVSYPFPTLDSKGNVVYSMWVQSGEGRSLEVFNPAWLDQTQQSEDFSNGLDAWSTFGTKGVELISHDQARSGQVLAMHCADPDWPAAAVWSFPSARAGTLQMRVLLEEGLEGAMLMLTDHFSVPFDLQDQFYSTYAIDLTALPDLPRGQWLDLALRWNIEDNSAQLLVNDQPLAQLPLNQRSPAGSSYLRLRCLSDTPQQPRLLIDTLRVEARPAE